MKPSGSSATVHSHSTSTSSVSSNALPTPTVHVTVEALLRQHANSADPRSAALDQVVNERNTLSSQNAQLWKLVEKQRAGYNTILKEFERIRGERDSWKSRALGNSEGSEKGSSSKADRTPKIGTVELPGSGKQPAKVNGTSRSNSSDEYRKQFSCNIPVMTDGYLSSRGRSSLLPAFRTILRAPGISQRYQLAVKCSLYTFHPVKIQSSTCSPRLGFLSPYHSHQLTHDTTYCSIAAGHVCPLRWPRASPWFGRHGTQSPGAGKRRCRQYFRCQRQSLSQWDKSCWCSSAEVQSHRICAYLIRSND